MHHRKKFKSEARNDRRNHLPRLKTQHPPKGLCATEPMQTYTHGSYGRLVGPREYSQVWRHSVMVAASRRRRPQSGHVRHAASADRFNLTTSPTPPPPPAPGAAAAAGALQARTALSMPPAGRARARSDVGTASRLLPCRLSPASRWPAASISSARNQDSYYNNGRFTPGLF